jgi:ornithine carrier protein
MLAREGAFGSAPSATPTTPQAQALGQPRKFHTSALARQLQTPRANLPPPAGPLALVLDTVRKGGLRGLWLGQLGTLFRETGGSSAWFTMYEVSSRYFLSLRQPSSPTPLTKADLATYELMISGAMAGVAYNVILFPADSIKSSMQTWAELNPSLPKPSFGAAAAQIWKTRGIRGMYAGLGITVARSAPSSAMIFLLYERLEKKFGYLFEV